MTTPDLLQRLPALREMFPREIQMDWPVSEVLRAEQQQRAATWKGLNAWRQSTVLDKNAMVFNEKIN
jgi:hypothetical protein